MKIFPKNPTFNKSDRERLSKANYLGGWNRLVKMLNENKPSQDDLKRLVFMELETPQPRRPILEKLIVRIQKGERGEIRAAIRKHCKQPVDI